jgi:hypothetical protein
LTRSGQRTSQRSDNAAAFFLGQSAASPDSQLAMLPSSPTAQQRLDPVAPAPLALDAGDVERRDAAEQ